MAKDPAILAHQEWLGYVQPVGLVVSIPAMLDANVRVNQNFAPEHRGFLEVLPHGPDGEPIPAVADFVEFAERVLGWQPSDLYGAPGSPDLPVSLEVPLPDYNETLRPTYCLREFQPGENASEWILLVKVLPTDTNFDSVEETDSRHWQASPQAKFERLLRQVHIPIGLLVNGRQIRLVYAPDKELSGHITFTRAVPRRNVLPCRRQLRHHGCLMTSSNGADEQSVPCTYANHVATHRAMDAWPVIAEAVRGRKGVAGGFVLATFAVVARHINHRDGETFLSYDTIAKETVTSRSTTYRSVQLLMDCHLLEAVGETNRACNTYRFGSAMTTRVPKVTSAVAETEPAPEPAPDSTSPAAQRLAADYAKALGRPVLATWAVAFDTLLGRESEAVIKDTFSWALTNEFWAARIKPFRGDPAKYLADKWKTIREAMSRPVLSRVGRNAPAAPSKMAEVMFAGAKSFKPMEVTA